MMLIGTSLRELSAASISDNEIKKAGNYNILARSGLDEAVAAPSGEVLHKLMNESS
jgi:hypothetical protein